MQTARHTGFVEGLTAGLFGSALATSAVLYLLRREELVTFTPEPFAGLAPWLDWVYANLGSSIPVFAGLLIAFFVTLSRLRRSLAGERAVNEIVQLDHLTDIWTTLFFGTGVIWTAIGMRSALLFALGKPDASIEQYRRLPDARLQVDDARRRPAGHLRQGGSGRHGENARVAAAHRGASCAHPPRG